MPDAHTIPVRWITYESQVDSVGSEVAADDGSVDSINPWRPGPEEVDDYGDAQFEPLSVLAVTVSVGWLLGKISQIVADHRRPGGQLVDSRGNEVTVRPLPGADRGTLVVVSTDSTTVYRPDRRNEGLQDLAGLLGNFGGK